MDTPHHRHNEIAKLKTSAFLARNQAYLMFSEKVKPFQNTVCNLAHTYNETRFNDLVCAFMKKYDEK